MNRFLAFLLLSSLFIGCAKGHRLPVYEYAPQARSPMRGSLDEALNATDAENRAKDIKAIREWYGEVSRNAATVQADMRKEADVFSATNLGIGGTGIAAGVAASALVVASPANAVWVAALSGAAASAAGYQTSLATQGLSRQAVAEAYELYNTSFINATNVYAEDMSSLTACLSCNDTAWFTSRGKVEADIIKLQALADSRPLRLGEKELKEQQTTFYKNLLQQQQDMYTSILEAMKNNLNGTKDSGN